MVLAQAHWNELNRMGVPSGRYIEFREFYKDDKVALQQIDAFDPSTVYHVHMKKYIGALKSGDAKVEAEEDAWFDKHYPDLNSIINWEQLEREWRQHEQEPVRRPLRELWNRIFP